MILVRLPQENVKRFGWEFISRPVGELEIVTTFRTDLQRTVGFPRLSVIHGKWHFSLQLHLMNSPLNWLATTQAFIKLAKNPTKIDVSLVCVRVNRYQSAKRTSTTYRWLTIAVTFCWIITVRRDHTNRSVCFAWVSIIRKSVSIFIIQLLCWNGTAHNTHVIFHYIKTNCGAHKGNQSHEIDTRRLIATLIFKNNTRRQWVASRANQMQSPCKDEWRMSVFTSFVICSDVNRNDSKWIRCSPCNLFQRADELGIWLKLVAGWECRRVGRSRHINI